MCQRRDKDDDDDADADDVVLVLRKSSSYTASCHSQQFTPHNITHIGDIEWSAQERESTVEPWH